MNARCWLASVVAVLAFFQVGVAQAQVTLQLKFVKGQTNTYDVHQDMKLVQMVAGKQIDTEVKQTIEFTQTVDDVLPDGSAKMTTKFVRMRMTLGGPVQAEVDSANLNANDDNPVVKTLNGVVKTLAKLEFTATQKPDGEASDLKIREELLKELRDLPGSAQMADMFTEQGIKQLCQNSFTLAKGPIKIGESWTQKITNKLPFGTVKGEVKFTYQGPETVNGKTLQKIAFVPTTTIGDLPANAQVAIKMTGQKGAGVILFDNELGRLQDMSLTQLMEMTVTVGDQTLEQTINQTSSVKLRK